MACAYVVNSPALQDDHEPEVLSVDVPIARALLVVELAALRCHVLGVGGERNEHDGHERTKAAAELFEGLPPMGDLSDDEWLHCRQRLPHSKYPP